jgi:hypothetical protein
MRWPEVCLLEIIVQVMLKGRCQRRQYCILHRVPVVRTPTSTSNQIKGGEVKQITN